MKEIGNSSDRGKENATVAIEKKDDILRSQYAEKLKFDPQHDIVKGGSGSQEGTSEDYLSSKDDMRSYRQMNRNKENKGECHPDARESLKQRAEEKKREEQYKKYQEKKGITYYR